jgi:hypothetical protein
MLAQILANDLTRERAVTDVALDRYFFEPLEVGNIKTNRDHSPGAGKSYSLRSASIGARMATFRRPLIHGFPPWMVLVFLGKKSLSNFECGAAATMRRAEQKGPPPP